MEDLVTGSAALIVGAALCLGGYIAIRIILPIWGALVGFTVGVALVAAVTGEGIFATLVSWVAGIALAIVFAACAYLYYEVSVVLAMGAAGFVIGSTVLLAFGVGWSWLVTLGGLALGVVFALLAIVANLPMVLLTVLTALAGAATATTGAMILVGALDVDQLQGTTLVRSFEGEGIWWLAYAALAVVGIVSQVRTLESMMRPVRDEWVAADGRSLREPDR